MKINVESFNYPDKYKISNNPVFVRNEINIQSSKEDIWFWLTNAITWPEWYPNASNVQILNQKDTHLLTGTKFKWRTFKANVNCEIKEFTPDHILAWEGKTLGLQAYHAWEIIPTKNGCKVITEEAQIGWLSRIGKIFMPNQLYDQHQIWLEGLKEKAEGNKG